MGTVNELKYKYNNLNAFGKIIAINVALFIIVKLLIIFKLGNIVNYIVLPADFSVFLWKPWTIFTYGFVHVTLTHLLFNMLFLYYLSLALTNLFRIKMVLNVYFLGILVGGTLYMLMANLWPTPYFGSGGNLRGASAGVAALLAFVGTYMGNSEIRPFNLFTIKWKYVALIFIGLDVLRLLAGENTGGYMSHIGGYLLGFYYAKQLMNGTDIGRGFERLADRLVSLFSNTPKSRSNMKTVHKTKARSHSAKSNTDLSDNQKKIDAILDKISKSGYESLTAKEKEFLFKQGK